MKQQQWFKTKSIACLVAACLLLGLRPPAAHAQDSLKVVALDAVQAKQSVYRLSFVASDTLAADCEIAVTFPAGFDLSKTRMAGSADMKGGFKATVNGNTVVLKRSGLGQAILPGQRVSILFGTVGNPGQATLASSFQIVFRNPSKPDVSVTKRLSFAFAEKSTKSK